MIVAACNRKLYSLVLSCTNPCKIPAEKTFLCFADKIGFVFALLVFYLLSIYLCGLFLYRRNPSGQSLHRKSRSWVKASNAGNLGRYLAGRLPRRYSVNPPKQARFSRRQGRCAGIAWSWLAYNFLLESKISSPVRWAFHLREPCDMSIHFSQWNQSCAFI